MKLTSVKLTSLAMKLSKLEFDCRAVGIHMVRYMWLIVRDYCWCAWHVNNKTHLNFHQYAPQIVHYIRDIESIMKCKKSQCNLP